MVMSPDALIPESPLANGKTDKHPDVTWAVRALMERGVRPAFGHFLRKNPEASAGCIEACLDAAVSAGARPFRGDVVTDHLFNDMPLNFKHAWRTREAKARKAIELKELELESWSLDNLHERCGVVPAAIARAAHSGLLTACINFDDEHVAIEIAKRAVEIIGVEQIMAMTDRTDRPHLGSQRLTRRDDNSLYYQAAGIVAAGSQPLDRQIRNMRQAKIDDRTIWNLVSLNASRVLELPMPTTAATTVTCLDENGSREFWTGRQWGEAEPERAEVAFQ
jgi:hypothetical protein